MVMDASPTRVLVVDDEAPIRLLCRVNLEAEGMKVLEAADGVEGVETAKAERPDVILLDVMMPGMTDGRSRRTSSTTRRRAISRSSSSPPARSSGTGRRASSSAVSTTSRSRSTRSSSPRSCSSCSTASGAASATNCDERRSPSYERSWST